MNDANKKNEPVTRFAIAGNGLEAWLTANHLLATLGGKRTQVTVCPVPGSDELDELYSIWPITPADGLASMGLSSNMLIRACRGSYSLGARCTDFFRPYGSIGLDFLGVPFHHHWLRAYRGRAAAGYFDWSPGTVAMKRGLFAPPVPQNAIGSLQHGMALHIDTGLFTDLLRDRAMRNGAVQSKGSLTNVQRESNDPKVSGLTTDNEEFLTADLYIDCSGQQKSLTRGRPDAAWVTAPGLEEYRLEVRKTSTQEPPPPFQQVTTGPDGWKLDVAGNGWNSSLFVTCSEAGREGHLASPGYLAEPWSGNCLAIGVASATFLPVEPLHARYLAISLKRMIDLMPGVDCRQSETIEYNKLARVDLREILDLVAAHEFLRKTADNSEFQGVHDSLKTRLALFKKRGWVTPPDSGFFETTDWVATFMQLGLVPDQPDQLAGRIPPQVLKTRLAELKSRIDRTVSGFPTHSDYLLAVKSAAQAR